jgi:alkanesulfonate monooxygenase SsuD/methylene tetrahydromethanopterin reductase-like flavin-dependent oxidoreductase (luciferase family)
VEEGISGFRLRDLDRDLPAIKDRLGRLNPPPTRRVPILVGGGGEKVTLRITAEHADLWHGFGDPDTYRHKNAVLDAWCAKVGRDPAAIERAGTVGASEIGKAGAYLEAGITHLLLGLSGPSYDLAPLADLTPDRIRGTSLAPIVTAELQALPREVRESVVDPLRNLPVVDGAVTRLEEPGLLRLEMNVDDAAHSEG